MGLQKLSDYELIEKAIDYFKSKANAHFNLDEIAKAINLTPVQFQELFKSWANTTPVQFFSNIQLKKNNENQFEHQGNLFENVLKSKDTKTNYPPNSLFYIEEMKMRKMNNDEDVMLIDYNFYEGPFGKMLLANSGKGICYAVFVTDEIKSVLSLNNFFPNAKFKQQTNELQENAFLLFEDEKREIKPIILHAKGTPFQLEVWHELIKIPIGQLSNYGEIAKRIGRPKAARAVGTAIGQNPIGFFIPCHRVIQSSGKIGGYMWGNTRKTALIGWELLQSKHIIKSQETTTN